MNVRLVRLIEGRLSQLRVFVENRNRDLAETEKRLQFMKDQLIDAHEEIASLKLALRDPDLESVDG